MAPRANRPRPAKTPATPRKGSKPPAALNDYFRAFRWRRAVEGELRPLGLTFTQWLILDATARAIESERDAVNQSDVARACELDRMTVSQVMKTLAERGLVDRGPSAEGPAYRIFLTQRAEQTLRRAEARLANVKSE